MDKANTTNGPVVDTFTFPETNFCLFPNQVHYARLYGNLAKDILCREESGTIKAAYLKPKTEIYNYITDPVDVVLSQFGTYGPWKKESVVVNDDATATRTGSANICVSYDFPESW